MRTPTSERDPMYPSNEVEEDLLVKSQATSQNYGTQSTHNDWNLIVKPKKKFCGCLSKNRKDTATKLITSSEASNETKKFVSTFLDLDLDSIFEKKVGPSGFYLKCVLAQACLAVMTAAMTIYIVTFCQAMPTFYCKMDKNSHPFECRANEYCSDIYQQFDVVPTFHSWNWRYKLYCNQSELHSSESMLLCLAAVLTGMMYFFSDRYSRVMNLFVCTFMTICCAFLITFIDNYYAKTLLMAPMIALPSLVAGTYGHIINESTTSNSALRKMAVSFYMVFYGFAGVVLALVLFLIRDADDGILFIAISNCLSIVLILFIVVDGPKFWFRKGKVNRTIECMVHIFNKSGLPKDDFNIIEHSLSQMPPKSIETGDICSNIMTEQEILLKSKVSKPIFIEKNTIESLSRELDLVEFDLEQFDLTIIEGANTEEKGPNEFVEDTNEKPVKRIPGFKLIFTKEYIWALVGFTAMACCDYLLLYGTIFESDASLNLGSIN